MCQAFANSNCIFCEGTVTHFLPCGKERVEMGSCPAPVRWRSFAAQSVGANTPNCTGRKAPMEIINEYKRGTAKCATWIQMIEHVSKIIKMSSSFVETSWLISLQLWGPQVRGPLLRFQLPPSDKPSEVGWNEVAICFDLGGRKFTLLQLWNSCFRANWGQNGWNCRN